VDYLVVADLFLIGLALDLVGAYILARGLLATPDTIVVRSGTYLGSNPLVAVQGAEDRVDGRFGVGALLSGFSLQALGYFLDLALAPSDETSLGHALLALALAASLGGGVVVAWRHLRDRLVSRTLVSMARLSVTRGDRPPERMEDPSAAQLASYGRVWRRDAHENETDHDYVRRVFGVERTQPPSED
jgi:hypothetical protein